MFRKLKNKIVNYIINESQLSSALIEKYQKDLSKIVKDVPTNDDSMYSNGIGLPECMNQDKYIYDFESGYDGGLMSGNYDFSSATINGTSFTPMEDNNALLAVPTDAANHFITDTQLPNTIEFKKVKPIEVVDELESTPTPFSLEDIDAKISILKDKVSLIKSNDYAKRETIGILERLENRKKYSQYSTFYSKYKDTTRESVQNLLNKYKLEFKTSDIFIPDFPDEAIVIMKDYEQTTLELCGKKPIFYVIAESNMFRDLYKKRDPILLVQSPFGLYYQVLGAWDKEMLILSEL